MTLERATKNYYSIIQGISQNRLAITAHIPQPRLSRIISSGNASITELVKLSLALTLRLDQAVDLLSRAERAFNPANKEHEIYKKIIKIYSIKEKPKSTEACEAFLEEANDMLTAAGFYRLY